MVISNTAEHSYRLLSLYTASPEQFITLFSLFAVKIRLGDQALGLKTLNVLCIFDSTNAVLSLSGEMKGNLLKFS